MPVTAWNWRQSVCPGTSCRKSDTFELNIVKKHTRVILERKNKVRNVFRAMLAGFNSMIYLSIIENTLTRYRKVYL